MAKPTFSTFRRWATDKFQPAYLALSVDERGESEFEDEVKDGSSMDPGRRSLLYLPLEPVLWMLRILCLTYTILTAPIQRQCRRIQAEWPPLYDNLGVFRHLVPSFFQPGDGKPARPLHPSAWLDGLRGVCAFLVALHHASLLWFSWRIHFGYGTDKNSHLLVQLPFPRILFNGPPQVAVFFVVSGYALSYKPLRLSRQGRHNEASDAIQSSVFRRHVRLFVAPVVFSFVALLLVRLDLYGTEGWKGVAIPTRSPPRQATFSAQLVHWFWHVRNLINPLSRNLDRGRPFAYDINYWTLPVEFDGSMVIFLCHAAFNRIRPRIRLAIVFGLACFAQMTVEWRIFLFLAGMFLCDLHFQMYGVGASGVASADAAPEMSGVADATSPLALALPTTTTTSADTDIGDSYQPMPSQTSPSCRWCSSRRMITILRRLATILSVLFALYLLAIPKKHADKATGYRDLFKYFTPQFYHKAGQAHNFWIPLGAVLLVFTIDVTPLMQRFFLQPLPQYLGKISYCMYLVHGTLIWTAGHWLVRHATALTGTDTDVHYCLGVFLSAVVLFVLVVYFADALTRVVDVPSVRFGRRLYERWSTADKKTPVEPVLPVAS